MQVNNLHSEMFRLTVTLTLIIELVHCQFVFPNFGNQPQQNQGNFQFPFQQIGFQQPNQNFVYPPNYGYQNNQNNYNPQRPNINQRPQSNNQWQPNPGNVFLQTTRRQVQPTAGQTYTNPYVAPSIVFPVQQQTTTAVPAITFRADGRISQKS